MKEEAGTLSKGSRKQEVTPLLLTATNQSLCYHVTDIKYYFTDIASWKADIPGKVSYVKHLLSCSQFPDCSRDVIHMLEKYFKAYAPDMPPNPGLYLSAFLDDVIDLYIFHGKGSGAKPLSAIQELQLLEVICSCFQDQPSDIVRCGVFYILFGISGQDIKDGKVRF